MTATMLAGRCDCGAEVNRQEADGYGAHILNSLPFTCDGCLERQEAEQAEKDRKREEHDAHERYARLDELDVDGRATALDAARRWAAGELKGLVLLGPIGVGKTTIAAAADVARMKVSPQIPRWINTVQALNDLGRDFSDKQRVQTMNALDGKHAPLILDDIDKAKPNANAAGVLFGAIDACMTNERSLLVTTNLMPSQLATNWPKPHGEAIASRLVGYCEVHRVTGRDRRLRAAA